MRPLRRKRGEPGWGRGPKPSGLEPVLRVPRRDLDSAPGSVRRQQGFEPPRSGQRRGTEPVVLHARQETWAEVLPVVTDISDRKSTIAGIEKGKVIHTVSQQENS